MTKPSVYVEISIVSYLTERPSRDLIIAAQQAMTREWWIDAPERFVPVASELVLTEAAAGDAEAAHARLTALETVTRLDTTENVAALGWGWWGGRGRGPGGSAGKSRMSSRLPGDPLPRATALLGFLSCTVP